MAYTEFTLWLCPREPLRAAFAAVIARLAREQDAVAFDPHVTVFCGASTDAEASAAAAEIAQQFGPIELTGAGLRSTERFTKTLFLQFEPSAVLSRMAALAAAGYTRPSNYTLDPHLSLLYKTLPGHLKQEIAATLAYPEGPYIFDSIRIIETELPIEDAGPVTRWRTVFEARLAGS